MKYKGYTITRTRGGNYRVKSPSGYTFGEEAVNLATAHKWADADRIEQATRAARR